MPISQRRQQELDELEAQEQQAERRRFMSRAYWKRSKKGKLWREYGGETYTIFKSGDFWKWTIAGADGEMTWSESEYFAEEIALDELATEIGLCDGQWDCPNDCP